VPYHVGKTREIMSEFDAITVNRKFGDEHFHNDGQRLDFNLLNFWQWSASDLSNNALRGKLAEFLVAQALGVSNGVRVEWDAYDIKLPNGISIEVKSSSYLQSWAQQKPSAISFDIRPTRSWNLETNYYSNEARRQAHLYVFCILAHNEKITLDPANLNQWLFYVLSSRTLDERLKTQKRISLRTLLTLKPIKCTFSELNEEINNISIQLITHQST
jgi:hypothetical protein